MQSIVTSTALAMLLALPASGWAVQRSLELPRAAAAASAPADSKVDASLTALSAALPAHEAASSARLAEAPSLPAPEPKTLAMMLAGLAALGLAASRRRG